MKKVTILSIIGSVAMLSLFLTAFKPVKQQGENYILVEIYEIPSYGDKGVHIHYGGSKREVVPFKEFTADNHDDNGDIILNTVNKLVNDGYVIESTTSGLANAGMITKIFMRKKML